MRMSDWLRSVCRSASAGSLNVPPSGNFSFVEHVPGCGASPEQIASSAQADAGCGRMRGNHETQDQHSAGPAAGCTHHRLRRTDRPTSHWLIVSVLYIAGSDLWVAKKNRERKALLDDLIASGGHVDPDVYRYCTGKELNS